MVGGIFYEHGHRMVAAFVGFLTVILATWLALKEERAWVRRLGVAALLAVIAQGTLGGLTVLYLLPTPISVGHAMLAQAFYCMVIAIALFTSPSWKRGLPDAGERTGNPSLPALAAMTSGAVYLQLLLGALMRHTDSGLAIPDFPLAFGRLVPVFETGQIAINFAHRMGAVLVTTMIVLTLGRILGEYREYRELFGPILAMTVLVGLQVTLGAFTVWTGKAVMITTFHVANGAVILGISVLLTLRAYRMIPFRGRAAASRHAQTA
jgi:cytochrome c oxidase assembly protein subunit 15